MGALPSTVVLRLMLMWREIKLNYMEILSSPGFCPYFVLSIISLHVDYISIILQLKSSASFKMDLSQILLYL